ncbi:hypothetical protein T459_35390 [Capsicum annuum]|uniref:Uncharacterized protein n=1 Tax=Capsicum annuum TaxID=4072 RepID=A0A2G2XTE4_CAPAN|nr:hypothetical protein T459_35390 [Capsicum annuum]
MGKEHSPLTGNLLLKELKKVLGGHIQSFKAVVGGAGTLYLSDNKLDGPVPKSFLNLTSLLELDLSDNSLGGNLPPFQMKSLQYIDLGSNCFRGQIPHEYGALQSVIGLYVDNNLLTGSIPQELGELSNLVTLEVNDNKLSGHIPHQLGKLIKLQYLVYGPIPHIGGSKSNARRRAEMF